MLWMVLLALSCVGCSAGGMDAYLARATFPSGGIVIIGGQTVETCEVIRELFSGTHVTPCRPVTITDRTKKEILP